MLSKSEERAIETLNSKNQWGLTYDEFAELVTEHQAARDNEDTHKMELIEFRLTDLNFHTSCQMLIDGEYQQALDHERD